MPLLSIIPDVLLLVPMAKIAIFPASGALGTRIYIHLFKLLDPKNLLLISRHPENTPSHLLDAGVTTRKADYNATESFQVVFDDVSIFVLISYPSIEIEHRFDVTLSLPVARELRS